MKFFSSASNIPVAVVALSAIGQQQHADAVAIAAKAAVEDSSTKVEQQQRDLQIQHCMTRTADPTLGVNCSKSDKLHCLLWFVFV